MTAVRGNLKIINWSKSIEGHGTF